MNAVVSVSNPSVYGVVTSIGYTGNKSYGVSASLGYTAGPFSTPFKKYEDFCSFYNAGLWYASSLKAKAERNK